MDALAAGSTIATLTARAKINLALHVVGRRPDGYHELESLVVFAEHGDELEIERAEADRLIVTGPFADGVPTDERNLVVQALLMARSAATEAGLTIPPLSIRLEKNLPHAAGIGGGSADAAAVLTFAVGAHPSLASKIASRALALGADVPMCFHGRPAQVRGIGERSEPILAIPRLPALLVNPGVAVSTPSVFGALTRRDWPQLIPAPTTGFRDADELVVYLTQTRNDLEQPAISVAPVIAEALGAVRASGAAFARMSGSGATVFGLFENEATLRRAADHLQQAYPTWWICQTHCVGTDTSHD